MDKTLVEQFLNFSESLKLVRNAEVEIDGKSLIDEVYTDLLPANGILNKVNLPRTTLLIGRKGTGKSTIFQKSQRFLDGSKKNIAIYIDVKSLYDNSSPSLPSEIQGLPNSQELVKYLIYSNFLQEIIIKIKDKLRKRVERNYVVNILKLSEFVLQDVFEELDSVERTINSVFKNLNVSLVTSFKNTIDQKRSDSSNAGVKVSSSEGLSGEFGQDHQEESNVKKEFDNTLVTFLDLKKSFIGNLLKIRSILGIKYLFVYLDDYSEIDKYAQQLFMDWFISPVNNLSEDFVKFKIATYPKRFYYGKLDNSKIDEISLDFFDAYYSFEKKSNVIDISKMEHLALDYTYRLIQNRIKVYFPNDKWESLFEISEKELYELLFNATMNIPRKIGYILSYCYESCLIHGSKINKSAIQNATLRYYTDVIEKYFLVNEFVCKPFEDKISNEHQYELLNLIVQRQVSNKKYLAKRTVKDTAHFYVNNDLSHLLDNLELNGFMTTYNKVKDSNNTYSTLYALDYGLCKQYQLIYGRPSQPKANSHTMPSIFNFNSLIVEYFNSTQVIKCENGHEFPYNRLSEFKRFKMNCPTCLDNRQFVVCTVTMKYQELKEAFAAKEKSEKITIRFHEYLILNFLKLSQTSVSTNRLSSSLDIALPTINNLIDELVDKEMIEYDISVSDALNKDYVKLRSKGARIHEHVEKVLEDIKTRKAFMPPDVRNTNDRDQQ